MCSAKHIGILGGTFNPPHKGHILISEQALADFKLDEVWWHITLQNPLKSQDESKSYQIRKALAERIIENEKILISGFEKNHEFIYTIDTVRALKKEFPNEKFILLMGADCFVELPKWKEWQSIMESIPIVVFPRPDCLTRGKICQAAVEYFNLGISYENRMQVFEKEAGWTICENMVPVDISSTQIRNKVAEARKKKQKVL